ncbi:hypothetical protein BDGL_001282 [Acinetobacter pittii PHEA-2]|uniref:Uncharacterized protein n=2 Tax=Acinetobacter pittii TaxID=48296 RepID=F0KPU8_ACIP2|nr:hypothetical protein [Acinetobacter pittii]YP_004995550.1 hypothetical protein BDGL_001282 [Acinetobacter pittii PHEA-2]ADY81868.1 hypothetical protein BDGL_001282 [Acinetobacter pittii PHEA-2]AZC00553.1 hypothetical protein DKE52_009565 [Acinetobacter pittii]KIE85982.1 hypothetical protein SD67_09600 [Acinetobacter pittii]MBN6526381.1 hypothetical protein [Acinetobacter pittii]MCE6234829.1 hypothetical protein [Acinetobacter pittii]
MFIEFKDLKKKRYIALLTIVFLIFSGGYLVVNNKGNIQRVESVIYTDKAISEKFGQIKSYSIRSFGSDHYSSPKRPAYSYKVDINGEKADGIVEIDMRKEQEQLKYLYTIKITDVSPHSFRIRIGKH